MIGVERGLDGWSRVRSATRRRVGARAVVDLQVRALRARLATMLFAGEVSGGDEVEVDATPGGLVFRAAERVGA
ncbi:MAG TPA: hypothetical protein VNO79_16660 [Actinomycetota bacterium]|nr:hypothetical protein [Actinomycetota bacterium]